MRNAFIEELIRLASGHANIGLFVGDLGFSVIEPFADRFPDRFINAGVAEQNMIGVAAGMASEGYHIFVYSIGNFPTLRCLEQIRNDVCYHNLSVTVVAVGAGMAYGNLGYSHHCIQDIGCLRGMPNMTIFSPADPGETRQCLRWLVDHPGPSYLRIGKAGEKVLHDRVISLETPHKVVDKDAKLAIAGTGGIVHEACKASEILAEKGVMIDVFSCCKLSQIDGNYFKYFEKYEGVVAVEEHVAAGGLGEMLAANVVSSTKIVRKFIPDDMSSTVGSQATLRRHAGIDALSLARAAAELAEEVSTRL